MKYIFLIKYLLCSRTPGRSPSGAGDGGEKGGTAGPNSTLDSSSSESVDGVDLPHKSTLPHTMLPQVQDVFLFCILFTECCSRYLLFLYMSHWETCVGWSLTFKRFKVTPEVIKGIFEMMTVICSMLYKSKF